VLRHGDGLGFEMPQIIELMLNFHCVRVLLAMVTPLEDLIGRGIEFLGTPFATPNVIGPKVRRHLVYGDDAFYVGIGQHVAKVFQRLGQFFGELSCP